MFLAVYNDKLMIGKSHSNIRGFIAPCFIVSLYTDGYGCVLINHNIHHIIRTNSEAIACDCQRHGVNATANTHMTILSFCSYNAIKTIISSMI